ncbi:MAG: hypothetical protein WC997_06445 [Porticoccaceae bacterium]
MIKVLRNFILCLLTVLITGCASSLTADKDPSIQLSTYNIFYVVRQPRDERGIEKLIAAELTALGKTAFSGEAAADPEAYDVVVTYIDKWSWDITTYMLELKVELRDPRTNYVIASGHSHRTSLKRKSPEGMVKEVLNQIFSKQ